MSGTGDKADKFVTLMDAVRRTFELAADGRISKFERTQQLTAHRHAANGLRAADRTYVLGYIDGRERAQDHNHRQ